jgi:hypothetical protein
MCELVKLGAVLLVKLIDPKLFCSHICTLQHNIIHRVDFIIPLVKSANARYIKFETISYTSKKLCLTLSAHTTKGMRVLCLNQIEVKLKLKPARFEDTESCFSTFVWTVAIFDVCESHGIEEASITNLKKISSALVLMG